MKQLVLVLLIAVTTLSVSAQKNYRNNDRNRDNYDRVDRYKDKHDRFDKREKEEYRRQLETINNRYNAKIRTIMRSPFLSRNAKQRKVGQLENERRIALNECRARFHRQMDYVERDRRDNRRKW